MTARRWTTVAGGVRVCHSRLYATASALVERDGTVLVVDPCWTPDELAALAADVLAAGGREVVGFATHAHHDHVLWHPDLGDGPRWASPATADLAAREAAANRAALGEGWPEDLLALVGRVEPLRDPAALAAWAAEPVVHDAHSRGHAALWLPGDGVLLAGDMLSDVEIPLAHETGLAAYDAGLTALRPYVERAAWVVPGHGTPSGDPMARWEADRRYLDAVLAGRPSDDPRLADPDMAAADRANRSSR